MKLIRAEITNFRLLKNLTLDFSCDKNKRLTVIRAANESGKTTCKTALLWGLFGNKALPSEGRKFALFPSDTKEQANRIDISVEIEFENDLVVPMGRGSHQVQNKRFRLKRSCIEYSSDTNDIRREAESVVLYEVTREGTDKVPSSQVSAVIESSLPEALKDVYFTDGDSAMSFIEAAATQGVKRRRVSRAIEALLRLDILTDTTRQLGNAASSFSSKIDNTDYKSQLEVLNDRIAGWEEDIEEWEEERRNLETSIAQHTSELTSINKKIEGILKLGNKEKLVSEKQSHEKRLRINRENEKRTLNDLGSLLRSRHLSAALISGTANKGVNLLKTLSESRQLPKVNIPILEELLDAENCFCGADLSVNTESGKKSRNNIKQSIEDSRNSDQLQEIATSLFYAIRSEQFDNTVSRHWMKDYENRNLTLTQLRSNIQSETDLLEKLSVEINLIKDAALKQNQDIESTLRIKLGSDNVSLGQLESKISDATLRKKEAEEDRQNAERRLNKTDTVSGKLNLCRMMEGIFSKVHERLVKEELRLVGEEMNRIFLEMIGSDPEANDLTLITEARLTEDFDILVFGPGGHRLDPDQDLNGASRRAITLAFILALTKVSQVEAPNVIDTPLGMMSGFVKRSVLNMTVQESSQVILFLTHDEISGVEDIIDKKSGRVYTLTNPAHYPRMLANEPKVTDSRLIRCECDHRSHCTYCERIAGEVY